MPSGETELGCQYPPFEIRQFNVRLGHAWRFRFLANTIESVQQVFSTQSMTYQAFIELDQQIRAFPVPSHLRVPSETDDCTWSSNPEHALQQYCVSLMRESSQSYFLLECTMNLTSLKSFSTYIAVIVLVRSRRTQLILSSTSMRHRYSGHTSRRVILLHDFESYMEYTRNVLERHHIYG